ncbi:hypothetical protein M770_31975 (plasmid) [Pseudomonas aeruginosa VRFPA03]|nr:hypothetical protein M770_31975 [Pseudomonas aeruginosa VRFPA03]
MKKVAILAYDGCWAMNLFAVTDFFRVVALLEQHLGLAPGYAVEVLSGDGAEVRAASGHRVQADGAIDAAQCYELVVIPAIEGVRLGAGFSPDARLVAWLAAQHRAGAAVLHFRPRLITLHRHLPTSQSQISPMMNWTPFGTNISGFQS